MAFFQIAVNQGVRPVAVFDEHDLFRPAAQGLDAHAPGSGKQVQENHPLQVLTHLIEKGFLHPIQSGPDISSLESRQDGSPWPCLRSRAFLFIPNSLFINILQIKKPKFS